MGIKVHTVAYRHDYGTDVSVYKSEELAYQGACKIISCWLEEVEDHEDCDELVDLINNGSHQEALELWSTMICDLDVMEEITVGSTEIVTEMERLVIDSVLNDEEQSEPN